MTPLAELLCKAAGPALGLPVCNDRIKGEV